MRNLFFVLGLLGVALYALARTIAAGEPSGTSGYEAQGLGKLGEEVAEIRSVLDETSRIARSVRGEVAELKRQSSPPAQGTCDCPSIEATVPIEPESVTIEHQAAEREAAFVGESYDRSWATWAEDRVSQTLAGKAELATIRSIDCRESTCRVEATHPSLDLYRRFAFEGFTGEQPWVGPRMTTLSGSDTDLPVVSVTFLERSPSDGT